MVRRSARMFHSFVLEPICQFSRNVTRPIIAEQAWLVYDVDLVTSRSLQSQIQGVGNIFGSHICAQFPRDDIATVIIQNCAQVKPTPAQNLEVGEVRLPKLIDGRGFIFELTCGLDHDKRWTGNQVMRL